MHGKLFPFSIKALGVRYFRIFDGHREMKLQFSPEDERFEEALLDVVQRLRGVCEEDKIIMFSTRTTL